MALEYKKIAVIGIGGSGKSTFSRFLAGKIDLPLFHLDTFLWRGNWKSVPEGEYLKEHRALIGKDAWIIEGYLDVAMADRLRAADLVLYLDYPGILCGWRVVRRWWKHRKESRPELPKEAPDEFDLKVFLRAFLRTQRGVIEETIKIAKPLRLVRFFSPRELEKFIEIELA